jgi:hypothetical protein
MTMATTIIWFLDAAETQFDFLVFDVVLNETHRSKQSVTSHPVEKGAPISDNVQEQPDEYTMEGLTSNAPPIVGAFLRVDSDRAEQIYEKSISLMKSQLPARIFTKYREYESMLCTSVDAPRDARLGDAARVRLSFRQVFVTESETVEAPTPTQERAKPKKAGGRKPNKESTVETAEQATLRQQAAAFLIGP